MSFWVLMRPEDAKQGSFVDEEVRRENFEYNYSDYKYPGTRAINWASLLGKEFGYAWGERIDEILASRIPSPYLKTEEGEGWNSDTEGETCFTSEQVRELISIFEASLAKMKEISYPEKTYRIREEYDHLWPGYKTDPRYSMGSGVEEAPISFQYQVKCTEMTIHYLKFMLEKGREITYD